MQTPLFILMISLLSMACGSRKNTSSTGKNSVSEKQEIVVGAARTDVYLPFLQGKNVALVVNQTSTIGNTHLVDSLLKLKVSIKRIFAPEHGFRGEEEAGAKIKDGRDTKTGLAIVSLHGKKFKPEQGDLKDVDILIFDIQDVGARFYTYISTLHYCMDACAENNKTILILDRPNPNGHYVDGPVLDPKFKSFIGLDPLPVVHGLTMGEFAKMALGESFLANQQVCNLQIIKCLNYTHDSFYEVPIAPSPNLKTMRSIYLYPEICFFEGTNVSLGRGTETPFEVIGYPKNPNGNFTFTPKPNAGSKTPPLSGQLCKGFSFSQVKISELQKNNQLNIKHLIDFYKTYPDKSTYFLANNFIDKLAGTDQLRKMILEGKTEAEIRASWQPALDTYKEMRKKYLLY
jgi:uncharacterized protein YbbC (DUF1343 family)